MTGPGSDPTSLGPSIYFLKGENFFPVVTEALQLLSRGQLVYKYRSPSQHYLILQRNNKVQVH